MKYGRFIYNAHCRDVVETRVFRCPINKTRVPEKSDTIYLHTYLKIIILNLTATIYLVLTETRKPLCNKRTHFKCIYIMSINQHQIIFLVHMNYNILKKICDLY